MRLIDQDIVDYLRTRKPYSYAHLVKFERPIISTQELDVSEREFVYLTDSSIDLYFRDPRVDSSPSNLANKYRANRLISIPDVSEYSQARATAVDLRLDGNAIGATLADACNITGSGDSRTITFLNINVYDKGFVEGDKITVYIASSEYTVEIIGFPEDNQMSVKGSLPLGSNNIYVELDSEELVSILQDKSSPEYASFINREVLIYKVFFDENNVRVGEPYYLYKGIIQNVSIEDNDNSIIVNWTMNSHWGDFAEVRGRITSDEFHRALDERGIPQPDVAIRRDYAYDKGFIHSDTAINIEANYTVQVEKQDIKYKKGFFGIGAKVKVKKYFEAEGRQTELDFQLQGKSLDVIYGVRPAEGSPVFADTLNNNSNKVYVIYTICEGEIGGIYDFIIDDKTLICSNQADFDVRGQQTAENNIDVICYGRSDRGDVLEGVRSVNNTVTDFFNTDYLTYFNEQSFTNLINYEGFIQPLGTSVSPTSVGLRHENSIKLTSPIDVTFSFYAGRAEQKAAPNLVQIASTGGFKIQADYWSGPDTFEYWGPNHRLLDTAYLVGEYTISEGETTIPNTKLIVKGKFVPCYNYDNSYQHYENASGENPDNFNEGDLVDIYSSTGTLLDSNLRIINKFFIVDRSGINQPRFSLDRQPNLGYIEGIPTTTKFYMQKGGNNWTMVTYNHVEHSGSISISNQIPIASVDTSGPTLSVNIAPSNSFPAAVNARFNSPDGFYNSNYSLTFKLPTEAY